MLKHLIRAAEKMFHPILLAFWPAFFVAIKLTYLDMHASSRLECGTKILRHSGQNIFSATLNCRLTKGLSFTGSIKMIKNPDDGRR